MMISRRRSGWSMYGPALPISGEIEILIDRAPIIRSGTSPRPRTAPRRSPRAGASTAAPLNARQH
jgi:hypothetical protein